MQTLGKLLERNLGVAALVLLLSGCLVVVWPFISSFLWAAVLCFSSWPVYVRILSWTGGRRTLAALLMSGAISLVILLPFVLVGFTLTDSIRELSTHVKGWLDSGPSAAPAWVGKIPRVGTTATELWTDLAQDRARLLQMLRQFVEPTSAGLLKLGRFVGGGLIDMSLSILVAFFLFRDGLAAAEFLRTAVNRVAGEGGRRLLTLAIGTVRGVVYGIIGTAIVQAVVAGIGFSLAGIPGAGVLAVLTFFLSPIPPGPPVLWLPAAVWLFARGSVGWGIFMLIWGAGVSSVDNVVRPWLISQETRMPFLLIFCGVIGGILAFGFIGVFLGPTLLAVGFRVLHEWVAVRRETLQSGSEAGPEAEAPGPACPDQAAPEGE